MIHAFALDRPSYEDHLRTGSMPLLRSANLPLSRDVRTEYIGLGRVRDSADRRQEPDMSSGTIDDDKLKALLKQALIELLQEKNEVLLDALTEVTEEIGLVKAIQEGQASPVVDEARVFEALEREP